MFNIPSVSNQTSGTIKKPSLIAQGTLTATQIPDKELERPQKKNDKASTHSDARALSSVPNPSTDSEDDSVVDPPVRRQGMRPRRLSTYESTEAVMDLENDTIGGSARQQ